MSLLENLPHKCTIGRVTRSNDALGGNVYGIVVEHENVPCWEQRGGATAPTSPYDKTQIVTTGKIYFNQNYFFTERNKILITERNGAVQANLDITDVSNPDTVDVVGIADPDASSGLGLLFCVMFNSAWGATE